MVSQLAIAEPPVLARLDGSVRIADMEYASWSAYFQSREFRAHGARCGTDTRALRERYLPMAPSDCSLAQTVPLPEYAPDEALVVPVVWHIVRSGTGVGDLSDARIDSQMEILNEDFRAWPGAPGEGGDDARLQFVLASEDPDGLPTTGINRYQNDSFFNDTGSGEMQRALAWDPTRYLNIYTANPVLGDETPVLGYATLPQTSAGDLEDGVVLHYSVIGRNAPDARPYDQGRTATHEVGHYFGLLHPFDNGCGDPSEPYTTGDLIADTPPEDEPTFVCESSATACDTFASIDNYMSYTPDACMTMFTPEQILRMRCSAIHYRPSLVLARTLPEARFRSEHEGRTFRFTDESTHDEGEIARWRWYFGDGNTSTEQSPTYTYPQSGVFDVTLVVADEFDLEMATTNQVTANLAPVAAFDVRHDGLTLEFLDTSYDSDGEIVSWSWDFGDGSTSAEQNPVHTYEEPGIYSVSLMVTDDIGASATATTELEPGSGGGCGCALPGRHAGAPLGPLLLALAGLALLGRLRRRPTQG
jgi:PKD repeat protein